MSTISAPKAWKNKEARERFVAVSKELGYKPQLVVRDTGGYATWRPTTGPFHEHQVRDERVVRCIEEHKIPEVDNVFSVLKVYLPARDLVQLLSISSAYMYDAVQHHLIIRTDSLVQNAQLALIALSVMHRYLSDSEVEEAARLVRRSYRTMDLIIDQLTALVAEHQRNYASEIQNRHCVSYGPGSSAL